LELTIARNVLACNEFKDRNKALMALSPSYHILLRRDAEKLCNPRFAKLFIKLFHAGKLPDWVIANCSFDVISLLGD